MRTRFNRCMNLEVRIYGQSLFGIIGCVIGFIVGAGFINILAGLVAAAGSFVVGSFLGKKWHSGELQRKFYKNLPFAKEIICPKIPSSHHTRYH